MGAGDSDRQVETGSDSDEQVDESDEQVDDSDEQVSAGGADEMDTVTDEHWSSEKAKIAELQATAVSDYLYKYSDTCICVPFCGAIVANFVGCLHELRKLYILLVDFSAFEWHITKHVTILYCALLQEVGLGGQSTWGLLEQEVPLSEQTKMIARKRKSREKRKAKPPSSDSEEEETVTLSTPG